MMMMMMMILPTSSPWIVTSHLGSLQQSPKKSTPLTPREKKTNVVSRKLWQGKPSSGCCVQLQYPSLPSSVAFWKLQTFDNFASWDVIGWVIAGYIAPDCLYIEWYMFTCIAIYLICLSVCIWISIYTIWQFKTTGGQVQEGHDHCHQNHGHDLNGCQWIHKWQSDHVHWFTEYLWNMSHNEFQEKGHQCIRGQMAFDLICPGI